MQRTWLYKRYIVLAASTPNNRYAFLPDVLPAHLPERERSCVSGRTGLSCLRIRCGLFRLDFFATAFYLKYRVVRPAHQGHAAYRGGLLQARRVDRQRRRAAQPHRNGRRQVLSRCRERGGSSCGTGKEAGKRQEVIPALSGQSGLKAAFVLLVTVPERPHFYTPSYSTRRVRRRPLIFPCKVKAVGNRQGAASFVVNNHQLASSSILVQHK